MKVSFALLLRVCAFAIAAVTALTALGCGAGGGKEREVPPGPATSAPPGNVVMYVSEGQGNRVAAYRLGTDGLPPAEPFSTIPLINPRRLLLVDDVLYVCLIDNVVSIEIEPDGSLPDLPTSITPPIAGIDAIDMVKVGDVLYVALEGLRVVAAYPLQNGQLTSESLSFSGTNLSDYRSIANRGPFIYAAAASSQRVDTYIINENGSLDDEPIPQVPQTLVGLPQDMVIVDDNLYIVDGNRRRIYQYQFLNTGLLPEDPLTETKDEDFYAQLIVEGGIIYASGFNIGQIDLYGVDPISGGIVSERPFYSTFQDVAAYPNGMGLRDGILYVTQSGRDRVDAYILGVDGVPSSFPSSSTDAISGSYPNAITFGVYPP